jgi:putative acetyltransferase
VDVIIRAAQAGELEVIIALQTLALVGTPSGCRKYNARQVDALVKGQARGRRIHWNLETILVAEADDLTVSQTGQVILGFICLSSFGLGANIQGIFVHPDFMGLGIGSRLLMAIEQLALQKRCRQMIVMSSMEAVGFYERRGYVIQGSTGFYEGWGVWIPCQMLLKDLVASIEPLTSIDSADQSRYEPLANELRADGCIRFIVTVLLMALTIVVLKYSLK